MMAFFTYLHVAVSTRLAELRRDGERGDSPVPTAVIIAGLVTAALAVTAIVLQKAEGWMNSIQAPGSSTP